MSQEKPQAVYVPKSSAKARKTPFGEVIEVSLNLEAFWEFAKANKTETGWLNLEVVPRKAVGEKGQTHSVKLNNWKPKKQEDGEAPAPRRQVIEDPVPANDPFLADPSLNNAPVAPDDIPF